MTFLVVPRYACVIPEEDGEREEETLIITGGWYPPGNEISSYNENGWIEDLPELNTPRWGHGCSYFIDANNDKVIHFDTSQQNSHLIYLGNDCCWGYR